MWKRSVTSETYPIIPDKPQQINHSKDKMLYVTTEKKKHLFHRLQKVHCIQKQFSVLARIYESKWVVLRDMGV